MLPVIWLNESASSPSWSRDSMLMRCVKSPCRTRSVPMNSSWTELVIERASASPITSATASMMRNITPISTSTSSSACDSAHVAADHERLRAGQVVVQLVGPVAEHGGVSPHIGSPAPSA